MNTKTKGIVEIFVIVVAVAAMIGGIIYLIKNTI